MAADETRKLLGMNFNTVLMFALIGLVGWMAAETRSNSLKLASVETRQSTQADSLARLETKLDGNIGRREYDAEIASIKTKLAEISIRLREIDVSLAKMSRQP